LDNSLLKDFFPKKIFHEEMRSNDSVGENFVVWGIEDFSKSIRVSLYFGSICVSLRKVKAIYQDKVSNPTLQIDILGMNAFSYPKSSIWNGSENSKYVRVLQIFLILRTLRKLQNDFQNEPHYFGLWKKLFIMNEWRKDEFDHESPYFWALKKNVYEWMNEDCYLRTWANETISCKIAIISQIHTLTSILAKLILISYTILDSFHQQNCCIKKSSQFRVTSSTHCSIKSKNFLMN